MIDSWYRRLLNHARIYVDENLIGAREWQWYYVASGVDDGMNQQAHADAICACHSLERLPWPGHPSIVAREVETCPSTMPMLLVNVPIPDTHVELLSGSEAVRLLSFTCKGPGTPVTMTDSLFGMARFHYGVPDAKGRDTRELLQEEFAGMNAGVFRESIERSVPTTGSLWRAMRIHPMVGNDPVEDKAFYYAPAYSVLCAFSSIVTPSHYMIKLHDRKGAGTKRMRRHMKANPVIAMIPYERLYQFAPKGDRKVKQHFRRGHIRHMWQQAGIDRFALPQSPGERLKLVVDRDVTRIYVHPGWVGDPLIEGEDYVAEVMTGESTLPPIGVKQRKHA